MPKVNIDLGSEMHEMCCPAMPSKTDEPKKYYPSFHYSGDKPLKLPREGEMVVRFKKTSSEHRIDGDKDRYACTVEIHEIVSVDAGEDFEAPAGNKSRESEDALDALAAAKSREKKKDSDGY